MLRAKKSMSLNKIGRPPVRAGGIFVARVLPPRSTGLVSYCRYRTHPTRRTRTATSLLIATDDAKCYRIVVTVQHSQTFERKALSRTYGRTVAHSLRAAMTRRRITILLLACNTRALRITRRHAGAGSGAGPGRASASGGGGAGRPATLAYRILKGDPPLMQP